MRLNELRDNPNARKSKTRVGSLIWIGICPPSNPFIATPDLDFCPLWPRLAVFSFPDPYEATKKRV